MKPASSNPVVHLELHTGNLGRACALYRELFGWGAEPIETGCGSYVALDLGGEGGVEGGVVECEVRRPLWLPYVEVPDVRAVTERARERGAKVALKPREGPAGWRSVLATPFGGEVAVWQPKR